MDYYSAIKRKKLVIHLTCSITESPKPYAKWKKSDTKDYILNDSINNYPRKGKTIVIKNRSLVGRPQREEQKIKCKWNF